MIKGYWAELIVGSIVGSTLIWLKKWLTEAVYYEVMWTYRMPRTRGVVNLYRGHLYKFIVMVVGASALAFFRLVQTPEKEKKKLSFQNRLNEERRQLYNNISHGYSEQNSRVSQLDRSLIRKKLLNRSGSHDSHVGGNQSAIFNKPGFK